jgi:hypothetical protein
MATSKLVPDGISAVRVDGVWEPLDEPPVCVVCVEPPLDRGGFDGGVLVDAGGGVSSTGYGLSALVAVVSVIDVSVSCFFWHAESPTARTSTTARIPAKRNTLMSPPRP